jgi:small GTP-binding protein
MEKIDTQNYKTEIIKDLNTRNDLFAKVEIIGDVKVGKSTILSRITKDTFKEEYSPTIGYEFSTYLIKVNNIVLKMQLWDMCGDENYRSVLLNLYRNTVVGILVYSVCSRESFNNLETWITNLKKCALPWSKLILLGNKCDDEEKREVTYEEGKKICDKYDLLFFMEVSAKEGFNSPNFLELAAISLYQDYENNKENDNDISATLLNRTESIMLAGTRVRKKDTCC